MTDAEDRLRRALHAAAHERPTDEADWAALQSRLDRANTGKSRRETWTRSRRETWARRWRVPALAAAAVIAVAVATSAIVTGGFTTSSTGPAAGQFSTASAPGPTDSTGSATTTAGTTTRSAPTSGNIPLTVIPQPPTATVVDGDRCTMTGTPTPATEPGGALPTVNTATTGAVVFWLPGMNSEACHVVATSIAAGPAQDLASHINAAKPRPSGRVSCPSDDGRAVAIYFHVPGAPDTKGQLAMIKLSGCQTINDARRLYSIPPETLDADLGPVMPSTWQHYVTENGW